MQEISKFLVDNWKIILDVILLVLSVILFIVRKRSFVFDNSNKLYSRISELIFEAEKKWPQGHGKEKLDFVVSIIIKEQCGGYHVAAYENYIKNIVEKFLSLPQKKGEITWPKEK